jgi:hypothetical protein
LSQRYLSLGAARCPLSSGETCTTLIMVMITRIIPVPIAGMIVGG